MELGFFDCPTEPGALNPLTAKLTGAYEKSKTGLGLAVSRGIVEKLGGRIEVESKVGQGAAFRVIIPERPPEGAREASCPVKLSA